MAPRPLRFWLILLPGCWLLDALVLAVFPFFRSVLDPLLLALLLLGVTARSGRWLWAAGAGMGLLRDMGAGNLVGISVAAFGVTGWLLVPARPLIEREDPVSVGVWAGFLSLAAVVLRSAFLSVSDPAAPPWVWPAFLGTAIVHGILAACTFPRLSGWLRGP